MAADTATANQSNGGDLLITIVIFQVLTWISVALRAYVRTALTKNFQFDDWLMLVAQVWKSSPKKCVIQDDLIVMTVC